jgi:hypothetical protein
MATNVGTIDRVLRLALGLVLVGLPVLTEFDLWQNALAGYGVPALGVVLVLTAAVRFCPLYRLLGVNTCRA